MDQSCSHCQQTSGRHLDFCPNSAVLQRNSATISRLSAALVVAREGLEPFKTMADQVDEWQRGSGEFEHQFDANDLRRARAALDEIRKAKG